MKFRTGLLTLLLPVALAACSNDDQDAEKIVAQTTSKAKASAEPVVVAEGEILGTPMAERVAVLGLLNKRDGKTRDVELKPGEAIRVGKVVIQLRACERTAPWETYPDEGAFVRLIILERPTGTTDPERWHQVFSGWLFKENPAANVLEHPVYDVWVKQCKMTFPGDEAPVESKSSDDEDKPAPAKKPSSAPQSPAPAKPAAPDNDDNAGDGEATIEN